MYPVLEYSFIWQQNILTFKIVKKVTKIVLANF